MSEPYPIVCEPILKPKVWGGRRLGALGKALPADGMPVGESWEVADLSTTSVSGGGGGEARTRIASGPMAGRTVREAMEAWGDRFVRRRAPDGGFPLLVKYLDAGQNLSVQVHPTPGYASANPGAFVKTESWYVVRAEPGASGEPPRIYAGVRPGVTRGDIETALRATPDGRGVVELLSSAPAEVGACWTLPSGTVHALGAGVMVAEVQTPSDTTFRVYDWAAEYGRTGRELHVEPALACIDLDGPSPAPSAGQGEVARTDHYALTVARLHCEEAGFPDAGGADGVVVMTLGTYGAMIASRSGSWPDITLTPGMTVVVPRVCVADAAVRAGPNTHLLIASIPL